MGYGLLFIAAGAVVVIAGSALARYGEAIAVGTRLGRLWVGAVLLASATSLPELGTDIAATRMGALDLAVGDLLGSCMANMLILALLDLLPPRRQVLRQATLDHTLAACLALSLLALAAIFFLAPSGQQIIGISPESMVLVGAYVLGTRAVYRNAMQTYAASAAAAPAPRGEEASDPPSLRRAIIGYAIAAIVTLAVAPAFAFSAKEVAISTGLGATFMGTWLVGASTSLPELAVSLAAVRMGSSDLAIGNLFGSNAFNIAILFFLDLAHPGGSVFLDASPAHLLAVLFGLLLTTLGLAAVVYRAKKRFAIVEPDSILIVLTYVLALWLLFVHRGP